MESNLARSSGLNSFLHFGQRSVAGMDFDLKALESKSIMQSKQKVSRQDLISIGNLGRPRHIVQMNGQESAPPFMRSKAHLI